MIGRDDLWYKEAIVYSLDVETFQDSNGDGIGDFRGLTRRLEHLAGLGVTCLWLMPFYPSPNRDNGYDVTDYYSVDPRLGTLGDFVDCMRAARDRGMRVVIDLVVNHTSRDHPWFQAARRDPGSPYREYYVWSEREPENPSEGVVFPGKQETIWTYDDAAGAWYLHRFYQHQPDLNVANPAVREEIRKVMGFWLELGVSGFRIDAAPFLVELKGLEREDVQAYEHGREPHDFIEKMREFLQWRRGDAVLLAEANVDMEEVPEYFGEGDRMHLLFHFMANQHLFLALARGDARPLVQGLRAPPAIPRTAQWAHFLRNHDELDLGRLAEAEREEVFRVLGRDDAAQLYGRGLRRRLAPMLAGDRRRLELAYSLLLTLPGTPVLYYGDEIGMGDDLSLPERDAVRTPMQWCADAQAGFSSAPSDRLVRGVIADGPFAYPRVNVRDQRDDPDSLLNWLQRMIRLRRLCPEWGRGRWQVLDTGATEVFALAAEWQGGIVLALHNLADVECTVTLDLSPWADRSMADLLRGGARVPIGRAPHRMTLPPYGYRWHRLGDDAAHLQEST